VAGAGVGSSLQIESRPLFSSPHRCC
jgi:hypothetical protein